MTLENGDILACLDRLATMEILVNGEKRAREVLSDTGFLAIQEFPAQLVNAARQDLDETGSEEQAVFQDHAVLQDRLECRALLDRKEFATQAIARCDTRRISKRRLRDLLPSP